ncbi:MAG TPA: SHD1 domain-containing protein [Lacipirellulaceae bacterium]|jgi:hypothetical protein|nr:SHD1 domain-containing protein [Lacipirellulaceae bacterium]
MRQISFLVLMMGALSASNFCWARTWTDKTGHYKIDADLIAFNDKSVVLQRADHELGMVPIDALSQADQEYLKSKAASEASERILGQQQTWKLANGMQLVGRVVGYARKQLTLQRQGGKVYVNDRVLENLPEIYQKVVPKIIAHVERLQQDDEQALVDWLVRQKGQPQTVTYDGVLMELNNGDRYCIPTFFFTPEDQHLLKPGWDAWFAASNGEHSYDKQSEQSFMLQSLMAARAREAQIQRQIATVELNQAVLAGGTSIWEVTLYPSQGGGRPIWVTEPGVNSAEASAAARAQHPGYAVGPVRKVAGY